jgi:gliding motility-associated transport system ATP-binding protein
MIDVENLTKHFGVTRAVDGISFAIEKGEVVGFLGPNGAGKTTTIRVLTCFHPATSGRAGVNGHDVFKAAVEVRRSIGYLAENVPLYPDLRVEEFLGYRAALKGVPRRERKAAVGAAMERCGVLEVRRKLVGHVSRGYRQRVGLADALVASPPILVLDEPTSGLDPNQRRKVKELVRELADDHTILFSSHILAEVEDVSTRVIVIDQGKIKADGRPRDLLEQSQGRQLVVCAAASEADLRTCLGDLEGSRQVTVESEVEGFTTLRYLMDPAADPRDEASARLAGKGIRIRELRLELPTLEEFFAELTRAPDSAPADDLAEVAP